MSLRALRRRVDVEAVEALLEQRAEAKKERDYDTSDALQAQLKEMGVYIDDRKRTWCAARARNSGFTLRGNAPLGVDVAAVAVLSGMLGAVVGAGAAIGGAAGAGAF